MLTEEYKKAYIFLSNKCSKKEISSREAIKACSKFVLKIAEKNKLINELKKQNFINHKRFSKAFVHDRFNFYRWGKIKIIHHLKQKGIEEVFIRKAVESLNTESYYKVIKDEAQKKYQLMNAPVDFTSKQKLMKFLYQKGFETDLVFKEVEKLFP
jgi:regulatory protein